MVREVPRVHVLFALSLIWIVLGTQLTTRLGGNFSDSYLHTSLQIT